MKFLSLEMPAFGPFTDFRLELPEEPSFHVLYGPNESGKSSTLRAIRGLLYGIDRRSCDNFLHQYTEMRIGGTLKHSDGRQLHLFRRKGNKQTLLSPQGEPLAEEVLSGFLGGLPPELFDRLYGLDHVSLVSGARVLLAEGGKVGESLFAASVGPQFRELLSQLAEEAKELWGPRSSTRLVNRSLKQWRESQEKVRQASLSAATWDQVFQELETMQQREGELAGEIRQLDTEIRMRRRWQKAAPLVSHRQDLQRELAEFAGIPQLSSDFSERRAQVLTELDRGKQQLKWSSENQASLKASLDALPEAWPVLALRSQIEGLEQRLGLIQESRRALPLVQRELTSLEKRRQRLLSDLGYNQTSLEAIPDAPVRVRTRRLVARYQTLQQQLQHDNEARKRSEERLGEIRSELARLRPFQQIQTLEQGLRRAQKQLVLDSRLEELARLQPEQSSRTRALLSKLPFRGGSEQLQELKVPQRQTVRAFETRFLDATRALETYLNTVIEHGFNASTFTGRVIISTHSDMISAVVGAIGALKGPLHGGANEQVMHMMKEIAEPSKAKEWMLDAIKNKKKVMGFGHRVYKSGDSRVPTMKKYAQKMADVTGQQKWMEMYDILDKTMVEQKGIHPNLDFPAGPAYYMMGFDIEMFTPIFVMARITGWAAHIIEQTTNNRIIRPLNEYVGSPEREVKAIEAR